VWIRRNRIQRCSASTYIFQVPWHTSPILLCVTKGLPPLLRPCLGRNHGIRPALSFLVLGGWLLGNPVEVLMERVQQVDKQLLAVVLLVAAKLVSKLG